MKKILVFGITDLPGGVESVIMNYYRNIDRNKYQFDFLCNTEKVAYEDEIKLLGGTIYRITARSKDIKKYQKDMKDFFEKHSKEYSTIWVNICSLANIDYLKYAKKYGIKHRIIHCHNSQNMDSFLRGLLHRWNRLFITKYATDFWSCSDDASKWFFSKKIMQSDRYVLLKNAIDLEKFRFDEKVRKQYRQKLDLEEFFVIGHIGRFHFQKNHEFLLKVFYELQKKKEKSKLILIGIGEDLDKIKEKVKELKLEDKVLFLGSRNDVNCLFNAMDLFLFPSLFEGLPVALLEAQANGLPIVTSEEGVPKEAKIVENFEYISLKESPTYWAEKILKIDLKNNSEKNIYKLKKAGFDITIEKQKVEEFIDKK